MGAYSLCVEFLSVTKSITQQKITEELTSSCWLKKLQKHGDRCLSLGTGQGVQASARQDLPLPHEAPPQVSWSGTAEPSLELRVQFGIYRKIHNIFSTLSQLRSGLQNYQFQVVVGMHSYVTFLRRYINLAKFSKSVKHLARKEWECHLNAANKCSTVSECKWFTPWFGSDMFVHL